MTTSASTAAMAPSTMSQSEPPSWLTFSVQYSPRHSVGRRRLDIVTTNNGSAEIVVTNIALRSEHFEELAAEEKTSMIRPDSTVNVKTDFGPIVSCVDGGPLAASVMIELRIGSTGPVRRYDVAVDPEPLDTIRENECNEQAILDAIDIAFAEDWSLDGKTVRTNLVFSRDLGNETVTVTAVRGMILFAMQPVPITEETVAVLDPDVDSVSVPVEISLARCDPHAVSQAPDGYSFRTWLAVGEREPHLVGALPHGRLLTQLEELVDICIDETYTSN